MAVGRGRCQCQLCRYNLQLNGDAGMLHASRTPTPHGVHEVPMGDLHRGQRCTPVTLEGDMFLCMEEECGLATIRHLALLGVPRPMWDDLMLLMEAECDVHDELRECDTREELVEVITELLDQHAADVREIESTRARAMRPPRQAAKPVKRESCPPITNHGRDHVALSVCTPLHRQCDPGKPCEDHGSNRRATGLPTATRRETIHQIRGTDASHPQHRRHRRVFSPRARTQPVGVRGSGYKHPL